MAGTASEAGVARPRDGTGAHPGECLGALEEPAGRDDPVSAVPFKTASQPKQPNHKQNYEKKARFS